tara:strand:- start:1215 stop:1802 length:588 start_codon:yes stop_codon:yes gene_type:complete
MREYEQKVASIHAWVIATKAENDELRKEVKRITGEHTHLQESVIKPLENVLVPVGLYSHQSYAACVTALREANADLIQRAEAAEKFSKGLEINLAAVIQRAEAAEKFSKGLEINLAAVIQRANAAEKALADCTRSHQRTNAKLAEVEKDAELLDWLIDRLNSAEDTDDLWDLCPGTSDDVHEEFRAAIRAARGKK